MSKAILISNLGSPAAPTSKELKPYLSQFLMDPYVIDIPYLLRFLLVKGLIIPRRSSESAHAYSKIWTKRGSPLVSTTQDLTQKVSDILSPDVHVDFAMRYGSPSFDKVLRNFQERGIKSIFVLPLYPQYALASTESTRAEIKRVLRVLNFEVELNFLDSFYKDSLYIDTSFKVYKEFLDTQKPFDHYLFSFHGIPERHVKKTDPSGSYCLASDSCCYKETSNNSNCYKHHCVQTTLELVKKFSFTSSQYTLSFQSRLGRDPWLKPYTDFELLRIAKSGVKRLAVFCPAFVADCLETIEEIGMRGREDFINAGGEELVLVPALNDHDLWASCIARWCA